MPRFNGPELANLLHALMRMTDPAATGAAAGGGAAATGAAVGGGAAATGAAATVAAAGRGSAAKGAEAMGVGATGAAAAAAGAATSATAVAGLSAGAPASAAAAAAVLLDAPLPSAPFLASALRHFRSSYGTSCTAPALAKLAFAAAQLGAAPSFNWMAGLCGEARRLIDMFTGRELAALLWSCVRMGHAPDTLFMVRR